ncbi:hypothetical protein GXM_00621 [Nostoc sphaeroides CCNUC1]|uniref:Uncharacterized protein n=1 Tax=Nostoc sphaeroides CCNUC1 TaxID=2653204 RepID=A0A5P8VRR9_9NOSO|nr:hypothetical protein GXM_00621 [Nostoc sphaeroides CCNUC1]
MLVGIWTEVIVNNFQDSTSTIPRIENKIKVGSLNYPLYKGCS